MIKLKNDFILDIATGGSRLSKKWRNRQWKWSELVDKCKNTARTQETITEYSKMSKEEQSNIKDVGGFVGGYLNNGSRKNGSVMYRSCATLDIDYGTLTVWDDLTMAFDFACMLYSTHKHSKTHPRYRIVIPFNRQVTPAEYEPVCRKIASEIGINLFDDTTYQLQRLFYWPSTSKDADYVFEYQDGPALNVDQVLAQYVDFKDVSAWPQSSREGDLIAHEIKKQGDPTIKPGLIGAFCRAYSIEDALEKFLSDEYEPTAMEGRYTYKQGSVAGGLVCYDGKYAYSHHETDPASRQLCNAFDLVRIHKFGVQDEGSRVTDSTRLPSYKLMREFCVNDTGVKRELNKERIASLDDDFKTIDAEAIKDNPDYNPNWMDGLDLTNSGDPRSTINNVVLILNNDPEIAGHISTDEFTGFHAVTGGLPWNRKANQWTDDDDALLRTWLEKKYKIVGKDKINDAVTAVFVQNSFHPIRQYLNSLEWDGVPRLEHLIIDYQGAADTEINRTFTRKQFTAAVTRIMEPGTKYDYCLILAGPEGSGKSTLISIMGGKWFSDSITTMEGKEGMDSLNGCWIIELGELLSMKRSEVETVKAFLSKKDDQYRAAYARRKSYHPRQCVFFGSTNLDFFLKGDTGNRRFWVIRIQPELKKYTNWTAELIKNRDQLWAEAVHYYREGEKLYLDSDMEQQARQIQADFNDNNDDPMIAQLYRFLDMKLPADWSLYDLYRRRQFIYDTDPLTATGTERRERFCAIEFLCEMMRKDLGDKELRYNVRRINKIMDKLPNWKKIATTRHAEIYGAQRGYIRIEDTKEEDI